MKKILCYIYDGMADFEITLLLHKLHNTGGREVISIAKTTENVTAQSSLVYTPHCAITDITDISGIDALIIPGGPVNNEQNEICELVKRMADAGKLIAAICFAPQFLGRAGLLTEYRYTTSCSEEKIARLGVTDPYYRPNFRMSRVVIDRNVITAQGYAFVDFAAAVCEYLSIQSNTEQQKMLQQIKGQEL